MIQNTTTFLSKRTPKMKSISESEHGISPFEEKPSNDYRQQKEQVLEARVHGRIQATDLFSLFTADIIKEEVVFTR